MILVDSNVLIYLMNGQKPKLIDWISQYRTDVLATYNSQGFIWTGVQLMEMPQ